MKKEKPASHYKKHLKELTTIVQKCLEALDKEMLLPSTQERGKRIAKICNALEMANDQAKHFGLDMKLKRRNDK